MLALLFLLVFHLGMDLYCRLPDQEQTTDDQHEVPTTDRMVRDRYERVLHTHDETDAEEEHQTRDHGQAQAQALCLPLALLSFQLATEDADHDDVIDPQHDLQCGQGDQCNDAFAGEQYGGS